MKNYLYFAVALFALTVIFQLFFKGGENPSEKEKGSEDYLSTIMDTKNKAEKNVNDGVKKETNKINEATMENQELVKKYSKAIIKTSAGDIEIEFFSQDAPQTVGNFLKLSSDGFYNQTSFHRIIKGFMIQGGDPLSKEADWTKVQVGTGGPGYTVPAEIKLKNTRGTIATARQGDQVNPKRESSGSQFFINTVDNGFLDGQYTVFGKVTKGMEVVDKIENSKTIPGDQPIERTVINSVELLEK